MAKKLSGGRNCDRQARIKIAVGTSKKTAVSSGVRVSPECIFTSAFSLNRVLYLPRLRGHAPQLPLGSKPVFFVMSVLVSAFLPVPVRQPRHFFMRYRGLMM